MLKTIVRQLNKGDLKVALKRNIFTSTRLTGGENTKESDKPKEEEKPVVLVETEDKITLIGINRPELRNAINEKTAAGLCDAFRNFENDEKSAVAVLYGVGGSFCSGYDLMELGDDEKNVNVDILFTAEGSVGPTRRHISKPVICAINGYCVANGLELALMCDLRIMEDTAVLGLFNRRLCVPLIDGGTARLPALIGFSRALDIVLTGRQVGSKEAFDWGLVNRVVPTGTSLGQAVNLAHSIAKFPQASVRHDRNCLYSAQFEAQGFNAAVQNEVLLTSLDIMEDMKNGIKAFNESDVKGAKCLSRYYEDPPPLWEQKEIDYEKEYEEQLKKDKEKMEAEKKDDEKGKNNAA